MRKVSYLIHHGKYWLLWDTGNGDKLAKFKDGVMKSGVNFSVKKTLKSQLAELNLTPDDIKYVVLSHLHPDHAGNVSLFPNAEFIIAEKELAWAFGTPTPEFIEPEMIAPLKKDNVRATIDDVDVFGDGTVMVYRSPGHTPGHRFLFVKLPNYGNLLITGDLYHTNENYVDHTVDVGNYSRAEELASFGRFDRMQKNLKAKVIIQHSPEDFARMPRFPKYLD